MPLMEAFGFTSETELANYCRSTILGSQPGSASTVDGVTREIEFPGEARKRRRAIGDRLKWWRDQGAGLIEDIVDLLFDNESVKKQRKRFARMATAHNPTRRLADEASNLYEEPPRRTFKDREIVERAYLDTTDEVQLDELLQEAQPIAFLCSAVLFWAVRSPATERLSLRLVTLDSCDPIAHPRDPLAMAGVIIDRAPTSSLTGARRDELPHFEVWDERFVLELNAQGMAIGKRREHGLGRIPGFLAYSRKPVEKLVEWERGGDITAAHECVAFLNLLALRLAKSQGENQPILKGDLARLASKQPADGETPIALPPGVTLEMLQMKTDPDHYLKLLRHFIGGVAQTYGMSYEQFTFQETSDTTSGRAYSVRREKLSEIRSQQARRWRRHEREIVILLGFDPTGFLVDFHDPAMPTDPMEELEVEEKRWRLGQSNPAEFMRKKNPDLQSDDEAMAAVVANVQITSALWSLLRTQNAPADADAVDGGRSPAANGALAQEPRAQNDSPAPGANGASGGREPQSRDGDRIQ
jgi:hypothetical protein